MNGKEIINNYNIHTYFKLVKLLITGKEKGE